MKQTVFNKLLVASIACVSVGTSVSVSATELGKDTLSISNGVNNKVTKKSVIKNGDFSDGLNGWIVSNPESNNPELITEDGVSYVKASYGENIHQFVSLKPNTTYTFSYTVASSGFPAKVEFGTLNPGESFKPLQEASHDNENWERKIFTFTTPEINNTYILRFSSTGNGWAMFKNIDVQSEDEATQNTLLSVDVESRQAFVNLNLTKEQFNSKKRYIVYLNGEYYFETYQGKAYYSSVDKAEQSVKVRRGFNGQKGEKIEVYAAPNTPGHSSVDKELLETLVVNNSLEVGAPELDNVVKNIQVVGNTVVMDLDQAAFERDNRIVLYNNGSYIAETYKGKAFYSSIKKNNGIVTVTCKTSLTSGDVISVKLIGNRPGTSTSTTFQQLLKTLEVK